MKSFRSPNSSSGPAHKLLERQLEAWQRQSSTSRTELISAGSPSSTQGQSTYSRSSSGSSRSPGHLAIPTSRNSQFFTSDCTSYGIPRSHTYQIIDSNNMNQYRATVVIVDDIKYALVSRSLVTRDEDSVTRSRSESPTLPVLLLSPEKVDEPLMGFKQALSLPWPVGNTNNIPKPAEKSPRTSMGSRIRGMARGASLGRKGSRNSWTAGIPLEKSTSTDSIFRIASRRKRRDASFEECLIKPSSRLVKSGSVLERKSFSIKRCRTRDLYLSPRFRPSRPIFSKRNLSF